MQSEDGISGWSASSKPDCWGQDWSIRGCVRASKTWANTLLKFCWLLIQWRWSVSSIWGGLAVNKEDIGWIVSPAKFQKKFYTEILLSNCFGMRKYAPSRLLTMSLLQCVIKGQTHLTAYCYWPNSCSWSLSFVFKCRLFSSAFNKLSNSWSTRSYTVAVEKFSLVGYIVVVAAVQATAFGRTWECWSRQFLCFTAIWRASQSSTFTSSTNRCLPITSVYFLNRYNRFCMFMWSFFVV